MRTLNKISVFFMFFLSIYSFGQKDNSDVVIIGKSTLDTGEMTPIFNLKKIKLNENIIEELIKNKFVFERAIDGYKEAEHSRNVLDSVDYEEREKAIEAKYGVKEAEIELRKTLKKVIPKTAYCEYIFENGSSSILAFFDNRKVYFSIYKNRNVPLVIAYEQYQINENNKFNFECITNYIEYYKNGNICRVYNKKKTYLPNDGLYENYVGFYGIYNEDGSIIKEIDLENILIYSSSFASDNRINSFLSKIEKDFELAIDYRKISCNKEYLQPKFTRYFDTNYGNIWVINYEKGLKTKYNSNQDITPEEQLKSLQNCYLIINDATSEIISKGTIEQCFSGNLPTQTNNYLFLNSYDYLNKYGNRDFKEVEKELNKTIIVTKSNPFFNDEIYKNNPFDYRLSNIFYDRFYILNNDINYFTTELNRVIKELYLNPKIKFSYTKKHIDIHSKEKFNFLNTGLILKYNTNDFILSLSNNTIDYDQKDIFEIDKNAVSIEFPDKLLKSFDIENNKTLKGKVELFIEKIQFEKKDFDLVIYLTGKFSNDAKLNDKLLYKDYLYNLKIIVSENHFKIYLNDEDGILIMDKVIEK